MKSYPAIRGLLSRRSLLKSSAMLSGAAMLPFGRKARAADGTPHFFLFVCVSGGMDGTYLFDGRPLKMTDKGKIHNYLYKNPQGLALANPAPILMTGSNGGTTWRTPLTEPLMPFQSDMTILNGVTMLTNGFISHGNNMYYLFTNSANSGRDSFMPMIGQMSSRPLEYVHIGGFEGDGNGAPTNFSSSIQLFPGQGGQLANALKNGPQLDLQSKIMQHVMARLSANAQGTGKFSIGSNKMQSGLSKAPGLSNTLKNVAPSGGEGTQSEVMGQLDIAMAYFKGGVTSSATLMYDRDPILDTHDAGAAAQQPKLIGEVAQNLGAIFAKLKNTAFDEAQGLSFLDVTTVLVTTEFSRSMGNENSVENTGTEHNPLTNTVILAGKGIKGGQVIGASDMAEISDSGEILNVSGAHLQKDSGRRNIMGRPFNFETGATRTDLPAEFVETDYLSFNSVANTMMTLFGVPTQNQFRIGALTAPTIKGVLK